MQSILDGSQTNKIQKYKILLPFEIKVCGKIKQNKKL